MKNKETSKQRRAVLKTAGVAGAAAGIWHKPVLNAVVSPAHAQTSEVEMIDPIVVAGPSSITPPITSTPKSLFENITRSSAGALISDAHAGVEEGHVAQSCAAFVLHNDDYRHCIELTFPEGANSNGPVEVVLTGPDVYYNYQCYYSGAFYYQGLVNFSGMASTTLADGGFTVTIGDVELVGLVDDSFEMASGTMVYTGDPRTFGLASSSPYYCSNGDSAGAYWNATLGGGECAIGIGPTEPIAVDPTGSECGF